MQISKYRFGIDKNTVNNIGRGTTFGAHYDFSYELMQKGDGNRYKRGSVKNYTTIFRNLKFFKELPGFLLNKYPEGVKIYDYACSRLHEASSIVITLFDALSSKEANKFLPIYAFDNNPKILKKNIKRTLELDEGELEGFKWFENINIQDYLQYLRASKPDQKLYRMRDDLSNNIYFDYGDIFEDLENRKFSEKPCVVFFRNAWQFLTENGSKELSKKLFDNLHPDSTVIIGDMDTYGNAGEDLLESGFRKISNVQILPLTFKNPQLQRESQYFDEEALSKFGFVKN